MSLTSPFLTEKLAAISSPFAEWISNLDTKHILDDHHGLSDLFKWDSKRGKHFQNLAQMILCIENLPNRTQPTSQKLATWLRREDPPVQSLKDEIEQVLNTYWRLASDKKLKAPFENHAKYVSPIEFVFIGEPKCLSFSVKIDLTVRTRCPYRRLAKLFH